MRRLTDDQGADLGHEALEGDCSKLIEVYMALKAEVAASAAKILAQGIRAGLNGATGFETRVDMSNRIAELRQAESVADRLAVTAVNARNAALKKAVSDV
jgi:hypothetical protein